MKESIYNSWINLSPSHSLLYNALQDKFIIMKRLDKPSLVDMEKHFSLLEGNGFIVDQNRDEEALLRERSNEIVNSSYLFRLTINPTLSCNFACWYCYEEKREGTFMSPKILERIQFLISKLFKHHEVIALSFFGGEPLIGFKNVIAPLLDFIELQSQIHKKNYMCTFTTNGALITEKMVSYLQTKNVNSFQITIDGGREHHNSVRFYRNGRGSYEQIIDNICMLITYGFYVVVRINYTDTNIDTITNVIHDILSRTNDEERELLTISLHQVWQNESKDLQTEINTIIQNFKDEKLNIAKPLFNNVYSPCYADRRHSAVINYNGDVYKCTAIDFLNTIKDGYLSEDGNIVWENDSLEKRIKSKFQNGPCHKCRIQPICNGGCSQKALHYANNDYCIHDYNESKKDKVILDRFYSLLQNKVSK